MKVTFLSAPMALTKSYKKQPDGSIDGTPYPLTSTFTSHVEHLTTIEEFYEAILNHSKQGHCLLKGNLQRDIVNESRAGLMDSAPTNYLVIDLDGLDLGNKTLDEALDLFGLGNTDYIIQYSASQGLKKGLYAHIFMLLKDPTPAEHLKQWLKWLNFSNSFLKDQLKLTKSNMSLHWTVDITVCQNDKLLYIAPPVLEGIADPTNGKRIKLIKKDFRNIALNQTYSDVDTLVKERIRQLRSAKGLPDHTLGMKFSKADNCEYLPNPDEAAVTGVKHDRGFTYLNLNGGDSWGYFHPINNPELLHNFKSEPMYKLRELAPSYYKNALEQAKKFKREAHKPEHSGTDKVLRWVINDRSSGKYFKVTYDPQSGITLDPAPTQKHYEDFCKEHGVPIPEAVSDWDIVFDPTSTEPFNAKERRINIFKPTIYKINCTKNYYGQARELALSDPNSGQIPREYYDLFYHVCGSDTAATNHFINWLAFVWQTGLKPETAWIFHGTYGTGKGRVLKILSHLFGQHCVMTTPEAVNEHFNEDLKSSQIVWIDEVTTDSWDNVKVTPKLRNWISEGVINIRAMRKGWEKIPSYCGFIAAANEHNPIEIRHDDRRWNVAPRQEVKLSLMPWATPNMLDNKVGWLYQPENLQNLANALYLYRVDYFAVRNPLENDEKTS